MTIPTHLQHVLAKGAMSRLAMIGLTMLAVVAISGCANVGAGSSGTAAMSSSSGSDAMAESVSSASAGSVLLGSPEWPTESFGDLPEPDTEAPIVEVSTLEGGASVKYRGMTEAEMAAYVDIVKSLGYTEKANETKSGTAYSYSAMRSGEGVMLDQVIIVYEVDKEGVATASIGRVMV